MTDEGSDPEPEGQPSGQPDAFDGIEMVFLSRDPAVDKQQVADKIEDDVRRKSGRLSPIKSDVGDADYLAAARALDAEMALSNLELERIERVAGKAARRFVECLYGTLDVEQRQRLLSHIPAGDAIDPNPPTKITVDLFREAGFVVSRQPGGDGRYFLAVKRTDTEIKHLIPDHTFRPTPPGFVRNPNAPTIPAIAPSELLKALEGMEETPSADGKGDQQMSGDRLRLPAPADEANGNNTEPVCLTAAELKIYQAYTEKDHEEARASGSPRYLEFQRIFKIIGITDEDVGILYSHGLLEQADRDNVEEMSKTADRHLSHSQCVQIKRRARAKDGEKNADLIDRIILDHTYQSSAGERALAGDLDEVSPDLRNSAEEPSPPTKAAAGLPRSITQKFRRDAKVAGEGSNLPPTADELTPEPPSTEQSIDEISSRLEGTPQTDPQDPSKSRFRGALAVLFLILLTGIIAFLYYSFYIQQQPIHVPPPAVTPAPKDPVKLPAPPADTGPLTMAKSTEAFRVNGKWAIYVFCTAKETVSIEDDLERSYDLHFVKSENETKIRIIGVSSELMPSRKIRLRITIAVPLNGKIDGETVDLNKLQVLPFLRTP